MTGSDRKGNLTNYGKKGDEIDQVCIDVIIMIVPEQGSQTCGPSYHQNYLINYS